MEALNRRQFLQSAILAGAGATLTLPKAADQALAASELQPEPSTEIDPNFIAGTIVDTVGQNEYLVNDPDNKLRLIRVPPSSQVWKRAFFNRYSVAEGDCLYARGQLQPDGALAVDRLWADIMTFPAVVMSARANELQVMSEWTGDELTVPIADFTEIERPEGSYGKGDGRTVQRNDGIQVVGFGSPEQGNFTASRIVLRSSRADGQGTSSDQRANAEKGPHFVRRTDLAIEDPESGLVLCPYTYYGITTWFCCGGILACGATCTDQCADNDCGGFGGFCTGCRTDALHMAWPNVCRQSGTDCRSTVCASCCSSFPQLICQTNVRCENPCNHNVTTCTIKDHGPQTRCTPPATCKNRDTIKFDLTACGFSAIGNINWGKQSLNATIYLPC